MNRTTKSLNIALLFGSKSPEHNISIITAFEAFNALKKTFHKVLPIYITEQGKFLSSKSFDNISAFKDKNKIKGKEVHFRPSSPFLFSENGKKLFKVDVALVATHGTFGEDGTLQGLLEMSGIPYTGSGVRASANSMDKITMKKMFVDAGLNVVESYSLIQRLECRMQNKDKDDLLSSEKKIDNHSEFGVLNSALIIKPSNLGSSIGISIAKNEEELKTALDIAFAFDDRVLVERALTNFSEYNCAVIGSSLGGEKKSEEKNEKVEDQEEKQDVVDSFFPPIGVFCSSTSAFGSLISEIGSEKSILPANHLSDDIIVSEIEKPISWNEFLTFDDKYNSKNAGSKREFPAKISEEETAKIKDMAKRAFIALGCSGVARVDFLKSEDGEIFVNEINTIPGSFSNYLFPAMTFVDILNGLFEIAIEEKKRKDKKRYVVESENYALKQNTIKK
ncbi:MAG: ATP-grasp domain-containing protein [Firmicutes bacterium]|nr:ATP-grasp domain-containing protein [Bacillota bacterium]